MLSIWNPSAVQWFKSVKNKGVFEWYTMEPVTERKWIGYINLCKVTFGAEGITKDNVRCCIMMQQSINQGYVVILSVHTANNKEQMFMK